MPLCHMMYCSLKFGGLPRVVTVKPGWTINMDFQGNRKITDAKTVTAEVNWTILCRNNVAKGTFLLIIVHLSIF